MDKLDCILVNLLTVTGLEEFAAFDQLLIRLPSEAAVVTSFRFRLTRKRVAYPVDTSNRIAADEYPTTIPKAWPGLYFPLANRLIPFRNVLQRQ